MLSAAAGGGSVGGAGGGASLGDSSADETRCAGEAGAGAARAVAAKQCESGTTCPAAVAEERGGTRRRPMAPQPHTHSVLLRGPDWPPASAPPAELRSRLAPEFCPGGDTNRTRPRSARAAADPSPPPPPERREEARDGGISRNHALPQIRGGLLVKESGSLGQKCVCKVHRYVFMHPTFLVTPLVTVPCGVSLHAGGRRFFKN